MHIFDSPVLSSCMYKSPLSEGGYSLIDRRVFGYWISIIIIHTLKFDLCFYPKQLWMHNVTF
jgi:hypothetical protein